MLQHVSSLVLEHDQVVGIVVHAVPVDVMDNLTLAQPSSNLPFSDDAVLKDVDVVSDKNSSVTRYRGAAILPTWMSRTCDCAALGTARLWSLARLELTQTLWTRLLRQIPPTHVSIVALRMEVG